MKIAIADDEHLVRYSIRSMLDDLALDLEPGLEAANGEDLLRLLGEADPDICLVDIRMPGMSGIDTMRRARSLGARVRWIVLSSYAEFDYASEAMRLGASAYLLKPASPQDLKGAILPLVEAIRAERRDESEKFERELALALRDRGQRNPTRPEVFDRRVWACKIVADCSARCSADLLDSCMKDLAWHLRDTMGTSSGTAELSVIPLDAGSMLAVLHCRAESAFSTVHATQIHPPTPAAVKAPIPDIVRRFRTLVSDALSHHADANSGELAFGALWLNESRGIGGLCAQLDVLEEFEYGRLFAGIGSQIDADALSRRVAAFPPNVREIARQILAFCVSVGDWKSGPIDVAAMDEALRGVASLLPGSPPLPLSFADYLLFRCGVEPLPAESIVETMTRIRDRYAGKSGGVATDPVVLAVEHRIAANYAEGIYVPDIAAELGLSPNYVSTVFHRNAGMTIGERLAAVRLEHARELLAKPGARVKETSFAVGYRDVKHFTKLFKEKYGRLPSEIGNPASPRPGRRDA